MGLIHVQSDHNVQFVVPKLSLDLWADGISLIHDIEVDVPKLLIRRLRVCDAREAQCVRPRLGGRGAAVFETQQL